MGVEEHEDGGGVLVGGGEGEGEALEDHGDGELGLEDGEVLAHAAAGAEAEGHVGHGVLGGVGHALGEAGRVELVRVVAPQGRVVMDGQDRDQQLRAPGDVDPTPAQHHIPLRPSYYRHCWRVQPQ